MKNILVPIGTSESSLKTLQYAVDFAAYFDATIYVMQVFQVISKASTIANIGTKVEENSKLILEDLIQQVENETVPVKIVTYQGDLLEGIEKVDKELKIDLIIIAPKSNDIRDEVFLGRTTGSIIKQTDIPTLIVPDEEVFMPFSNILTAFKSGIVKNRQILVPLKRISEKTKATINLLLVKTPNYVDEDLKIDQGLKAIAANTMETSNATTFQGVLEHFQTQQPDLLCVFRRKRGFFSKLWEKNVILKRDFHCSIPLLVLSVKKY